MTNLQAEINRAEIKLGNAIESGNEFEINVYQENLDYLLSRQSADDYAEKWFGAKLSEIEVKVVGIGVYYTFDKKTIHIAI